MQVVPVNLALLAFYMLHRTGRYRNMFTLCFRAFLCYAGCSTQHGCDMTALIFTPAARTILSMMEASTGHRFYAAEFLAASTHSKPTILRTLRQLSDAKIIDRQPEPDISFRDRPPRIYYEYTPWALSAIRLIPTST
jgi:hypothetical protein